jgi:DNA-directed RNA polymerase subunit beta'
MEFSTLRIGLASADDIRSWSSGEVKKPETINYRTLKPEKDGLFCERIFGPTRDWECSCGKYKRVRFKGITCERCGVEITKSNVRKDRMGHIELACPVTHIWYFKGVPSRLGAILDISPKDLEKVIYYAAYMITYVDEKGRHEAMPQLEAELSKRTSVIKNRRDAEIDRISKKLEDDLANFEQTGASNAEIRKVKDSTERELLAVRKSFDAEIEKIERVFNRFKNLKVQDLEGDAILYKEMKRLYGDWFEGGMGAATVQKRLETYDLATEVERLKDVVHNGKGQKKVRALKRLKVLQPFLKTTNQTRSLVLDVIPVIPPDLRPMLQLDGGRFATSDLNDLYRRVINRNNRLKKMIENQAPEIIVNNEKRMLQESVDALFDNGRRGRPVTGLGGRPLKSLSEMLKGKQGRFRQNLLGKRVDYSGRSVIVVGPQLKLHQCGLPKQMALELFKPMVMKRLVDLNHAQNIKSAKRMVERIAPVVWDMLEEVITEHPVLLNRAPTLHRLGIQAFEPVLIEGKAIQIHPLVCTAFNADFDGDQMAVHVPLSPEAQAEARILMLASNNILSPASGKPITTPTQDMVLGIYYLTSLKQGANGEGTSYSSIAEAIMAFDQGYLDVQAEVNIRLSNIKLDASSDVVESVLVRKTTLGRALFNDALPGDFLFVNKVVGKKDLESIVNVLADKYMRVEVAGTLDQLKEIGFYWATRSGVSIGIEDVVVPANKEALLADYEEKASKIDRNYERGLIALSERREQLVEVWTDATDDISKAMEENFKGSNPVWQMAHSGARGNMLQVRQLAGMRGLVTNTKGEIIPRPIKSNFREGLTMLEYFISAYGARKGLADTALRTADAGYLTRRLVDVSQDVIVRERDCETENGLTKTIGEVVNGVVEESKYAQTAVLSRSLAKDVVSAGGEVLAQRGDYVTQNLLDSFIAGGVTEITIRTILTCENKLSACGKCYGMSLATNRPVEIGEAIGIIAAQSIGEPGTQLTMRTFHTGGVVGAAGARDITHGLPRVVELFEAREPKGKATISAAEGTVRIEITDKDKIIWVMEDSGEVEHKHKVAKSAKLVKKDGRELQDGDRVDSGEKLTEGVIDPKEHLSILGSRKTQDFLVEEVQKVYRDQGQSIHDKHIEVIVQQMLRRIIITDGGDTDFLDGDLIDRAVFTEVNRETLQKGGKTADGRPELMGITKASLATESWLSAASFQETTKVLTNAALEVKEDRLLGLKENVIVGKLIPAGTGLSQYRNVTVEPTEEAKAKMYASLASYADDYGDVGFGSGSGEAVLLDDLRLNDDRY